MLTKTANVLLGVGAALTAAPTAFAATASGVNVTWEWLAAMAMGLAFTLAGMYAKGVIAGQNEKISELQRDTKSNSTAIASLRELLVSEYQRASKVDTMFTQLREVLDSMQQQLYSIQSERKPRRGQYDESP